MDFLKGLGITTANDSVQELKASCFEVFESKSMIKSPLSGELIHDGFFTISNDQGKIHGKVSKSGGVLPMDKLIEIAYQVSLRTDLPLDFVKAKLNYFKDQSICTLNIPLGVVSFTNAAGLKDETEIFLFIKNGFGGNTCIEIGIFSYRFVCGNGLEIRKGLDFFKSKHTKNMNLMAQTFLSEKLPVLYKSANGFQDMAKKLDRKLITKVDIENFKKEIFNYKKSEDISKQKLDQINGFNGVLDVELTRCGSTAWGLLQAATNYTNNVHKNSSKDFIITGTGANINATAESFALAL